MKKFVGYQKGVNLGGWLSQGPTEDAHYMTFIEESDFEKIASWGCDHVRIPIDFECVETADGERREIGFERFHTAVSWARKYNLNIVLDLHKAYGYIFDDQEYSVDFFDDIEKQDRFVDLWDKLSKEFAEDTDIMAFELLNEIVRPDVTDKWNEIAQRAVEAIHANVSQAWVIMGGIGYNAVSAIPNLKLNSYDHICFNFHTYAPMAFTHQGAYWVKDMPLDYRSQYPRSIADAEKDFPQFAGDQSGDSVKKRPYAEYCKQFFLDEFEVGVKAAEEKDCPLYCGEYGVIDLADPEATLRWFQDINAAFVEYGIGRSVWNYREKDFGISGEHYAPVIDELIKYL